MEDLKNEFFKSQEEKVDKEGLMKKKVLKASSDNTQL